MQTLLIEYWPIWLLLLAALDAEAALLTSILLVAAQFSRALEPTILMSFGVLLVRWLLILRGSRLNTKSVAHIGHNPYTIARQEHETVGLARTWLRAQIPTDYPARAFTRLGETLPRNWRSVLISIIVTFVWCYFWVSAGGTLLALLIKEQGWLILVRENILGYVFLSIISGTVLRMIVHRLRTRFFEEKSAL